MANTDTIHNHTELIQNAREYFLSGATKSLAHRETQLRNLNRLFIECEEEILEALALDMRKSRQEAILYEVEIVKREIRHMQRNLAKYIKPTHVPLNLLGIFDRAYILPEPYGVVLVIGTWNYPFLLTCKPAIGAIAAGNVVILKPSEVASHSAAVLARRIPEYLDPHACIVLQADGFSTQRLIREHHLDYVFCTSSQAVGQSVLEAAAHQLTPCTLELGGKSPCFIHASANFQLAAKRILWGKLINLGQTCIAPDYILCSKEAQNQFLTVAKTVLQEWYGGGKAASADGGLDLQQNPDLPRIVNLHHFKRLESMLHGTKGRVALGGETDAADLWIAPTIVVDVDSTDSTMQQEIFGPILPVLIVDSVDDAIATIAKHPNPLALYIFAKDRPVIDQLLEKVVCGSVCINDSIWQNAWDGLPFGGVGSSGMGKYHGRFSFDTFSHHKSVLHRGFSFLSEKLGESRYPPYTPTKVKIFKLIVYNFHRFDVPSAIHMWLGLLLTTTITFGLLLIFGPV